MLPHHAPVWRNVLYPVYQPRRGNFATPVLALWLFVHHRVDLRSIAGASILAQTSLEQLTQLLAAQRRLGALHDGFVLHTDEAYGSHATALKYIDGRWWWLDSYCPRRADLSDPVNLTDLRRVGKALHALFPVDTLDACIGASIFRPSSAPAATAVLDCIDEMMHDRPSTAAPKRQRDVDKHSSQSTAPRAAPQPSLSTTTECVSSSPSAPLDPCNAAPITRSVAPATTTAIGPTAHVHLPGPVHSDGGGDKAQEDSGIGILGPKRRSKWFKE